MLRERRDVYICCLSCFSKDFADVVPDSVVCCVFVVLMSLCLWAQFTVQCVRVLAPSCFKHFTKYLCRRKTVYP